MSKDTNDQGLSEGLLLLKEWGELVYSGVEHLRKIVETPEVQNLVKGIVKGAVLLGQYTAHQQHIMKTMSLDGWFPSLITFMEFPIDNEDIDGYMERVLTKQMDDIKHQLYEKHPTRKEIIQEALSLFDEERYISAIPLLISQIDGIGEDKDLTPFFSSDPKVRIDKNTPESVKHRAAKLPKLLEHALGNKIEGIDPQVIKLYEDVITNAANSFIMDRTPNVDTSNEMHILNRNGIMHGHKDFLKYGTKKNALKMISLLLFVDHMLSLICLEGE